MANHKSAIKRNRQNTKKRLLNKSARSAVRTAIKAARQAKVSGDENAPMLIRKAESMMAKAKSKGLYHPRTLGRTISRLAK